MVESDEKVGRISIWVGRGLGIVLFFLLGAFLIQHIGLLLVTPRDQISTFTLVIQLVHFMLLIGYLVSLKNDRIGSLFIVVFSVAFLLFTTMGITFWIFLAITISPIYFYMYGWLRLAVASGRFET
jgi:hypothetical protein